MNPWVVDREELAWAAGLYDGEGSTTWGGTAGAQMLVSQSDPEVLHRFRAAVGVGKVYGPYSAGCRDGFKRKPKWMYKIDGFANVQAVVALLWRKLGTPKRRQAAAVLLRKRPRRYIPQASRA